MRSMLFALLCTTVVPAAWADVPARTYPSVAQVGASREQPQALSHWQKMAEDMAEQAAPRLRGVSVSAQAQGLSSAFDVAFHDFFVTALHRRGVNVVQGGPGARVEIDTFPLRFQASRRTAHVHDQVCYEHYSHRHCRYDHRPYRKATRDELAVSVRVFDAGRLAFSGSTTYYLPAEDLPNYQTYAYPATPVLRVRGE